MHYYNKTLVEMQYITKYSSKIVS